MTEFQCAIEQANRPANRTRCSSQCESCKQAFLPRDDGRPMTTCETYGGLYFDFADPRPEQITVMDVAHHLSQTCRFGSGTTRFYSVAHHALHVRQLVLAWGAGPEMALAALHHDSHEYMLGDWPTPLKRMLRAEGVTVLDRVVQATNAAIATRFGIVVELLSDPMVKQADAMALYVEASTFQPSRGTGPHWGRETPAPPLTGRLISASEAKYGFLWAHELDGGLR